LSDKFIVINDKLERSDRVLYQTKIAGKRAKLRRGRERECVRGSALWKRRDGVSHKMSG